MKITGRKIITRIGCFVSIHDVGRKRDANHIPQLQSRLKDLLRHRIVILHDTTRDSPGIKRITENAGMPGTYQNEAIHRIIQRLNLSPFPPFP